MPRHRSSAVPLACMYAALIVYASLYPFTGWRAPRAELWAFLTLPWPRWWTTFDLVSNLLGYMPLGALIFGAIVRSGWSALRAGPLALLIGSMLSLGMEVLQNFLPQRVSSNVDLGLNIAGTLIGIAAGWALHRFGVVERWQALRDRWFIDSSAGGLALLVLWPVGLLFPLPAPLGQGQVVPRLREAAEVLLRDTAAEEWIEPWLQHGIEPVRALAPGSEMLLVMLGLLGPCLLAFTIARPGLRRVLLVVGLALTGIAATTLSTALNFGPDHSLAWSGRSTPTALGSGVIVALLLAWVPRRAAAGLGLIAMTALVALVAQAPHDAYFADSLKAWEQGRFIRFHGAAQWVGWLWPFIAMAYLLSRIASRDPQRAS